MGLIRISINTSNRKIIDMITSGQSGLDWFDVVNIVDKPTYLETIDLTRNDIIKFLHGFPKRPYHKIIDEYGANDADGFYWNRWKSDGDLFTYKVNGKFALSNKELVKLFIAFKEGKNSKNKILNK